MHDLKRAWEQYQDNGDGTTLLFAIKKYGIPLPPDCEYPFAHRIRDIKIGAEYYRVVRLADELETIYIIPCDTPSLETDGVPYWLQGQQLRRWVSLESEGEADDDSSEYYEQETDTNWDLFR